jgi:NADH:ubiquinone oxidoreductase subunit 3 (subunit A)
MNIILTPPLAFLVYIIVVGLLMLFGRSLAGTKHQTSPEKRSIYASGEAGPDVPSAPGYRQFFVVALFFAVLHLGILIAGSGTLTYRMGVYLGGLIFVLLALILG